MQHITVVWDIDTMDGPRRIAIANVLKESFRGHWWVRPLSNYYIVQVRSASERAAIRAALAAAVQSVPDVPIRFLISPLMPSANYDGYLPSDMWSKVNQATS